jgi:hypothetical protein
MTSGLPQVTQESIQTGGGDNAGRDVVKTYNISFPPTPGTRLADLLKAVHLEAPEHKTLVEHMAQLQVFTRTVTEEKVVGLEGKLNDADRRDQLDMALHLKEMIYAELQQNCFSPAFQRLYAYILGRIWWLFDAHAKPAILAGKDRATIDAIVSQKIVQPIVDEASACGVANDLTPQTIAGMLYYLTGNCHVRWR